jgi:hypothetical protein
MINLCIRNNYYVLNVGYNNVVLISCNTLDTKLKSVLLSSTFNSFLTYNETRCNIIKYITISSVHSMYVYCIYPLNVRILYLSTQCTYIVFIHSMYVYCIYPLNVRILFLSTQCTSIVFIHSFQFTFIKAQIYIHNR